uniref:rolling circle replication-associated protein n=1 Tax=Candidatus Enterococcus willemsii TaxID=1857215 RepID=UPI00403FBF67
MKLCNRTKENIRNIETTNDEFKKFIKRLNYQTYKTKKSQIKYLATWEKQKRGAIHYHIVLFSLPFVPHDRLMEIWGHGLVWINKIDVDAAENRGRYLSKYFDKDLDLKEHKKKAFFKSQNLKIPKETKRLTEQEYDTNGQEVLHTKNYIRRSPKFSKELNESGALEQVVEFEESNVKYTKIKKDKNTETH